MASYWTNKGKKEIVDRDATAADLRLLLVNTPPASAGAAADLNFVADVSANELSGTGYARKTLATKTITEDDTNDRAVFDCDDPSVYTALNAGTIAGAWVFRQVTNDADSALWMFLDCTDLVTNGGDVTVTINSAGLSTVT